MQTPLRAVLFLAAVAMLALASPAHATHVQCGDTITQSTNLDSDVVCPDTGAEHSVGIYIGANDVTLRLMGHTIRNEGTGGAGVSAHPDTGEFSKVHVIGGTLEGWANAVGITGSDSSVRKLTVLGSDGVAIGMLGARPYAYRNVIENTGPSTIGMMIQGEDAYAWGNTVRGSGFIGIYTFGDRPRLVYNTVENCAGDIARGIDAAFYTEHAVINRNTVTGCGIGINAYSSEGTGGAVVRLNEASGNDSHGLSINDGQAIVGRNTANGNGGTGIHSLRAGTRIQHNVAMNNGIHGIYGGQGTVDGGGNVAGGNGDGTRPQCVNVECTTP
jgi:hypothetical protein